MKSLIRFQIITVLIFNTYISNNDSYRDTVVEPFLKIYGFYYQKSVIRQIDSEFKAQVSMVSTAPKAHMPTPRIHLMI